jgi:hypothetical protein
MLDNNMLLRAAQANGFRTDRIVRLIEQEQKHVSEGE